jgi:aminopeptidase YwaD
VINIDGVGHIGSKNMFSFFNFDENIKNNIIAKNNLLEGEQWYSGDHAIFAFQEIPCIAITASDMFTELIKTTHTQKDKAELVSINLLKELSETVANIIEAMDEG